MLSPADAELVDRDGAIPGLHVVLDEAAIAHLLADAVPELTDIRVDYLRYKPATSMVAGLVLTTPAGTRHAQAAAFHPAVAPSKLAKLGRRGTGPSYVDAALGLAVVPAEADRRLPGIRIAAKQPRLVGHAVDRVQPVRYNPGRRWVAIAESDGVPHRLVKAHDPLIAAATVVGQRRFAAAGLPVPALRRFRTRHGLVTFDWVPGAGLDTLPVGSYAAELGELVARVHRAAQPPARGARAVPVHPAVRAIGAVLPELRDRAALVAASCERWWVTRSGPISLLHGDFSADQVIVGDGRLWLTDLDRVRFGDPATDLGSFAAAELVAGRASEESGFLGAITEAYLDAGGPATPADIEVQTAAALLCRAIEPFRRRAADWPARVESLLARAEAIVGAQHLQRLR